jgi:DNA processing protein
LTNNENKQKLINILSLLDISGVGRGRYHKLIKKFGSPQRVLSASVNELENVPGIAHATASEIVRYENSDKITETVDIIFQLGWKIYFSNSQEFPKKLSLIPEVDIPPVFYTLGKSINFDENMIAIVGSRHASEQGKQFAYRLARELSQAGIIVVSGMAEGIDSFAHRGALDGGGETIAVWGNSLDIVYPPSNKELAEHIKKNGMVLSEYPPQTKPDRTNFPERNRIISGLCEGVVVVEAGRKSGALITASEALKQGRELFAVPGSPDFKMSEGANRLIQSGAKLITGINDIFEELPRLKGVVTSIQFKKMPDMTDMEKKIVDLIAEKPLQVDNISRELNLPVPEIMEFLLALELKGITREISGKRFMLTEDYV